MARETKETATRHLIFVYNSNAGLANALLDIGHRLIKPSTYPCKLCAVTYGRVSVKKHWKDFIKQVGIPATFWHRDEFMSNCKFPGYKVEFPAVIIKEGSQMITLMEAEDFKEVTTLDDLIHVLSSKLINRRATNHG